MRNIILFLLFGCFFFCFALVGQNTKVIPPAPTAASLGKYAEMPVSLYTGSPQISIPIWEVKDKNITLPITLNYHSSGVKVSEIASWVGMGWSLNAGGVITRTVRDKDDLEYNGYANLGTKFPDSGIQVDCRSPGGSEGGKEYVKSVLTETSFPKIPDTEPDMFHFNFLGKSGSFVFDQYGRVNLITQEKIKIELIAGTNNPAFPTWKITTEEGLVFIFTNIEQTSLYNNTNTNVTDFNSYQVNQTFSSSVISMYASSWFLTSITSPSGESISFNYDDYNYQVVYPGDVVTYKREQPLSMNEPCCRDDKTVMSNQVHNISGKRLTFITSSDSKIIFLSSPRCDLIGDRKLDKIEIHHRYNQSSLKNIKSFVFTHGYYDNDEITSSTPNCDEASALRKRLWLRKVQEFAGNNSSSVAKPPHQFFYLNSSLLPARATNGGSTLPNYIDSFGYFSGDTLVGVRQCNEMPSLPCRDCREFGMLSKIIYPTGGFTSFKFESYIKNQNTSYLNVKRCINLSINGNGQVGESAWLTNPFPYNPTKVSIKVTLNYLPSIPSNNPCSYVKLRIIVYPTNDFNNPITYIVCPSPNTTSYIQNIEVPISRIETSLIVDMAHPTNPSSASITWDDYIVNNAIYQRFEYMGGVRIKEKVDFDGNSSITTKFDYVGGKVMSMPAFKYKLKQKALYYGGLNAIGLPIYLVVDCIYNVSTRLSCLPLGQSAQGGHIGYDEVIVTKIDDANSTNTLGKTVYTYSNKEEVSMPLDPVVAVVAILPNQVFSHSNGSLLKTKIYDTQLRLIEEVNNQYTTIPLKEIKGVKISGIFHTLSFPCENIMSDYYSIKTYRYFLSEDVKKVYDYSQGQSVRFFTETTKYFRENPLHEQVTKIVKTDSQGENIITEMKYAEDYLPSNYYSNLNPKQCNEAFDYGLSNAKSIYLNCVNSAFAQWVNYNNTVPSYWAYIEPIIRNCEQNYVTMVNNLLLQRKQCINLFNYELSSGMNNNVNAAIKAMVYKHIVGVPTRTLNTITKNNIELVVGGQKTEFIYSTDKNQVLINKSSSVDISTPIQKDLFNQDENLYFKPKILFSNHDNNARPQTIQLVDGIKKSYIYGYTGNNYPVCEVLNIEDKNILYNIFHTSFEDETGTESSDSKTGTRYFSGAYTKALTGLTNGQYKLSYWTQSNNTWQYNQNLINVTNGNYTISLSGNIDEIRFYPANALMNTYTFQPLIGMTSQTDTNNQTIYYEYDTFQRLRLIKDEKGNILKQNIYHYKNE